MRIQSFEEMCQEYGRSLDSEDLAERTEMLTKYSYSIIIEGEWMEFDNLDKWMKQNIPTIPVENIGYGKTGYDFGFFEFFFIEKESVEKLTQVIPNIYTIYPASNIPNHTCKSNGYDISIDYDPTNKEAIVYPPKELLLNGAALQWLNLKKEKFL